MKDLILDTNQIDEEEGEHGNDYTPSGEKRATNDFYDERPNNNIFIETSKEQDERVRRNSPFGHLKTWKLIKIIVKSNDDVRQEQFAMQLIQ